MCTEASLSELVALQKQHKIVIKGHNQGELVELLKQCGVLPPDYVVARGVKAPPQERETPKQPPKYNGKIREHHRKAELALTDDEIFQPIEVQVYPSMYKAAKFLGTFNTVVLTFNRRCYKSKVNSKTYQVNILDPAIISL